MHHPLSKLPEKTLLRFWSKVDVTPGCWLWTPTRALINGYGMFTVRAGVQRLAHRLSYELHYGEVPPKGMHVRHRCDEPLCVNPDHLLLGTPADNMRDKVMRGRQARGESSPMAKLTDADVREIRAAPDGQGRALARKFGVAFTTVSKIRNGHSWKHVA